MPAEFVADPFMLCENGVWYMFFEVLNSQDHKGNIGLAISKDGFNWDYQKIVLEEPFHLSYPYVFKWENEYYLIPESFQAYSVRLYKATDFPTKWLFAKTLLYGDDYVDSSILCFKDKWWLFNSSTRNNILRLYYANELMGDWIEHPKNPLIKGNVTIARPGGRLVVINDMIIRYAQNTRYIYGNQLRAFEITQLTTTNYEEKKSGKNPIIKASGVGWNKYGMHHIDPHQIGRDKWIACVDGNRCLLDFGIAKV